MKFDPTLFYKGLADDFIEYISYHDGEKTVINFLLKLGYTPEELIENVSFNKKNVEEVVQKTVEKTVRNYFGLDDE